MVTCHRTVFRSRTVMRKPTRSGKRESPAFTLVELLIVITILALLAGIMASAVANVMRYADNITCQNNLRQIAMCVLSYTADYKGAIPPTMVKRKDGTIYYWCNLLATRYLPAENTLGKNDASGQPVRTSKNTVLLCPSSTLEYVLETDTSDSTGTFNNPDHNLAQGWYRVGNEVVQTDCSYYWNGYTGNDSELLRCIPSLYVDEGRVNAKDSYHNIAEIPQRAHLVMVTDGVFWLDSQGNTRPQRIAARHTGEYGSRLMTNMAFYDSHVESFDRYAPIQAGRRVWSQEEVVGEMHLPVEKRDLVPIMPRRDPILGGGPPYFYLPKR